MHAVVANNEQNDVLRYARGGNRCADHTDDDQTGQRDDRESNDAVQRLHARGSWHYTPAT